MLLRARYVVPVDGPPIENGAARIEESRITAIGPANELCGPVSEDFGDAVILPGFVNAHTHLELTHLAGRISPSMGFVPWIKTLAGVLVQESSDPSIAEKAVTLGVRMSLRAGVTLVGDIARDAAAVRPVLAESEVRSVSFGEVIGIGKGRDRWRRRLEAAACDPCATPRLWIGISPHAPYTVEPEGLRACAERARQAGLPLCIHVAETPDEDAFTRRGAGALVELLRSAEVWDDGATPPGVGPIELCEQTGLLGPSTLLAHANYVSDDDISVIAARGSSVAYCPRTHAAFAHNPHRFRDMLAARINVCLGTDSLASNPSLSILDELRFLRQRAPDVALETLLRMATTNGAKALGFGEVGGTLRVGAFADLAVVSLPRGASRWDAILEDNAEPIAVYIDGRRWSPAD